MCLEHGGACWRTAQHQGKLRPWPTQPPSVRWGPRVPGSARHAPSVPARVPLPPPRPHQIRGDRGQQGHQARNPGDLLHHASRVRRDGRSHAPGDRQHRRGPPHARARAGLSGLAAGDSSMQRRGQGRVPGPTDPRSPGRALVNQPGGPAGPARPFSRADAALPWMGMRLRLRADYDCTLSGAIKPDTVAPGVCNAMKK